MNEPLHTTPAHALNWTRENAPDDILRQDGVEEGWKSIVRITPSGTVLFLRHHRDSWYWSAGRRI